MIQIKRILVLYKLRYTYDCFAFYSLWLAPIYLGRRHRALAYLVRGHFHLV